MRATQTPLPRRPAHHSRALWALRPWWPHQAAGIEIAAQSELLNSTGGELRAPRKLKAEVGSIERTAHLARTCPLGSDDLQNDPLRFGRRCRSGATYRRNGGPGRPDRGHSLTGWNRRLKPRPGWDRRRLRKGFRSRSRGRWRLEAAIQHLPTEGAARRKVRRGSRRQAPQSGR